MPFCTRMSRQQITTKTVIDRRAGKFWLVATLGMQIAAVANGQIPGTTPQHPMTFFVTSSTPTGTGNLGGLEGADRICQNLATAAGAGNHTWHAYLSTQAQPENGNGVETQGAGGECSRPHRSRALVQPKRRVDRQQRRGPARGY